jgi:hypothetical protein
MCNVHSAGYFRQDGYAMHFIPFRHNNRGRRVILPGKIMLWRRSRDIETLYS